jgi:hypothetical protein
VVFAIELNGVCHGIEWLQLDRVGMAMYQGGMAMDRVGTAMDRVEMAMDRVGMAMDRVGVAMDQVRVAMDRVRVAMGSRDWRVGAYLQRFTITPRAIHAMPAMIMSWS